MTLKRLQSYRALRGMIDFETERLQHLRDSATSTTSRLDGMPRASGYRDKIGELVPRITDVEEKLTAHIRTLCTEQQEIEKWISSIDDVRVKLIILLRFLDGLSWMEISDRLTGKETEYSVKHTAYRYIKQSEKGGD